MNYFKPWPRSRRNATARLEDAAIPTDVVGCRCMRTPRHTTFAKRGAPLSPALTEEPSMIHRGAVEKNIYHHHNFLNWRYQMANRSIFPSIDRATLTVRLERRRVQHTMLKYV